MYSAYPLRLLPAAANQRKGRCGRIAPGVCIRLYSEEDFSGRPEFTEPEILRTNLASVILQMANLRLGSVDDFDFIEPPDSRLVTDGHKLLDELGAITAKMKRQSVRQTIGQNAKVWIICVLRLPDKNGTNANRPQAGTCWLPVVTLTVFVKC